MFDAICDICGRQTAEPHEIKIHKLYDDKPMFVRVICDKCADIMEREIELLKILNTTKPASWQKVSYMQYCPPDDQN